MALITTPATILKTYEYSETSKIIRLLTLEQGLCSVIAKGARRPKSRFGGVLEPFTDGVATYYAKEGRELHNLSSFELHRERQALGRELGRFAGAGLLTEMALRFAPAARDPVLFRQLRRGLDRLVNERGDVQTAILEETWAMVVGLGFAPNLEGCSVCGRAPAASQGCHLNLMGGDVVCEACQPNARDPNSRRLTPRVRDELLSLVRGPGPKGGALGTTAVQLHLLRDFVSYHLADNRPLNSFRFLERQG